MAGRLEKDNKGHVPGCLAEAEVHAHGISIQQDYFHEVRAVDAIEVNPRSALGLPGLEIEKLYASALPTCSAQLGSAPDDPPGGGVPCRSGSRAAYLREKKFQHR